MISKDKLMINEKGFWPSWFSKLLFTLISVKVWGLVASITVSTILLYLHNKTAPIKIGDEIIQFGINGAQWVTFNTTVWALIFGMKEIFRISEKRDKTDSDILKEQADSKIKLASLKSSTEDKNKSRATFTPDGLEIVGEEPDDQI